MMPMHPFPPYTSFMGCMSKLYDHLIEFGQIGYVTILAKIKTNWKNRSEKMIMVGYAEDKPADTYQMFNPWTQKIIKSRNII